MTHAGKETAIRDVRDRLQRCAGDLSAFLRDQSGASFVAAAIAFPMILGMAALGFDTTIWYMTKRQIQTVADNAALVGIIELSRADSSLSLTEKMAIAEAAIVDEAARDGFVEDGAHDVVVNVPPSAGAHAGDAAYLEVLVVRQHAPYLSWMFRDGPMAVQARAVGGMMSFGTHCVVALDGSADRSVEVMGTADITSDCGIASNSSSQEAIYVGGKATLSADPAQAFGEITTSGGATLDFDSPPQPLTERVPDPYAEVLAGLQADASCVGASTSTLGTADSPVSPGRFCGGIKINSGTVDFLPGTYYLDNGGFTMTDGTVTGAGVTFILTAMDATDLGSVSISGGTLDLRAPKDETEGEYPGMLFIQDPNVPNIDTTNLTRNKFVGNSTLSLDGALYFPHTDVDFGGAASGAVNCTLIVSKTVAFHGDVTLDNDAQACQEAGVGAGIQQIRVRLFE